MQDSREVCVTLPCPTGPLPPCKSDEPVPDIVLCCATCVIGTYVRPSRVVVIVGVSVPMMGPLC